MGLITGFPIRTEVFDPSSVGGGGLPQVLVDPDGLADGELTLPAGEAAVYDCTLVSVNTLINVDARDDDQAHEITLILRQGLGAQTVDWTGVLWPNGAKPLLSFDPGSIDVLRLMVTANGAFGLHVGGWYA
jgi:hypothetical protein